MSARELLAAASIAHDAVDEWHEDFPSLLFMPAGARYLFVSFGTMWWHRTARAVAMMEPTRRAASVRSLRRLAEDWNTPAWRTEPGGTSTRYLAIPGTRLIDLELPE